MDARKRVGGPRIHVLLIGAKTWMAPQLGPARVAQI